MRFEKDCLGEALVPDDSYLGIDYIRAKDNFPFSGPKVPYPLIRAYGYVKKACALANWDLGYLQEDKAKAILQACDEIIQGKFDGLIDISAYQGGAGTSTNMAINEIIANRSIELLGGKKGDYSIVHPIEDVNMHQSTNDTYPTAVKVSGMFLLRNLSQSIAELQGALQEKEKEFSDVVKLGRTEMQPAVPITLGAEFGAFAEAISRDRWRVFKCEERLRVVNLGGTAVGTGLTAPRRYIFLAVEKLREITGLPLSRAEHIMGDTAFLDSVVEVSGILLAHASNLVKIANDLRLMNMLGEIRLPPRQRGSSIMPGKINPVVCEAVIQIGLEVMESVTVIAQVNSMGSFQINEFLPLLAHKFLGSLELLISANKTFLGYIKEIKSDPQICRTYLENNLAIITAFLPEIGYERADSLVKEYLELKQRPNFRDFLEGRLGVELVRRVLSPDNLTRLGYREQR